MPFGQEFGFFSHCAPYFHQIRFPFPGMILMQLAYEASKVSSLKQHWIFFDNEFDTF